MLNNFIRRASQELKVSGQTMFSLNILSLILPIHKVKEWNAMQCQVLTANPLPACFSFQETLKKENMTEFKSPINTATIPSIQSPFFWSFQDQME